MLDPVTNDGMIPSAPLLQACDVAAADDNAGDADTDWLVQVSEAKKIEPGYSEKVRCRLIHPVTKEPLLQPRQFLADVGLFTLVAASNENGSFKPHMPNNGTECQRFERGDIIGTAQPLASVEFVTDERAQIKIEATTPKPRKHTFEEVRKIQKGISKAVDKSDAPESYRREYKQLLSEFEDTISASQEDIGKTDVTLHTIELPNGPNDPAFKGQYRLAWEHLQLIKDNVVGWLRSGLVERATSKFNAQIFCVPKPHGRGLRIMLDYRSLNDKTVPASVQSISASRK